MRNVLGRIKSRGVPVIDFLLQTLIHVEVALQDALLEGIGALWNTGSLANGWLHSGHALCAKVLLSLCGWWGGPGNGGALSAASKVLGKIEAFTCGKVPGQPDCFRTYRVCVWRCILRDGGGERTGEGSGEQGRRGARGSLG